MTANQLTAVRHLQVVLLEAAEELAVPGSYDRVALNHRVRLAISSAEALGLGLASGGVNAPTEDFPQG